MSSNKMFYSLIPWAVFTLAAGHGGTKFVAPAALVATVLALAVAIYNTRGSSLKIIDASGVLTFAAITVIAFVSGDPVRRHLVDYGRGSAALILALVMFASLLFTPFTEQYARESVPEQYWHSPVFRAVNRKLTAIWGTAILVMSGGHFLSGHLEAAGELHRRTNLTLNWIVPVLLVLGALKLTRRLTEERPSGAVAA
jgi:hypothetical protein